MNEKSRDDLKAESPTHLEHTGVVITEDGISNERRKYLEKKIKRRLDTWLMPTLIVVFIMNYIDRNNVSAARLRGLEEDLSLTTVQYESTISILYASYIVCQVPSNVILNYVSRPGIYMGCAIVCWGTISALTGATHNFWQIALCRIAIGIPEAAFYPGAVYILSRWYTKKELAFRSALLYVGLLISNAFGSLMAAGILDQMEGKLGVRAWRWLFYIEGAITIAIGFIAMYTMPDYPHNCRWFTLEERLVAQQRLAEDGGEADVDGATDTALRGLKMAWTDRKVLLLMTMNFGQLLALSHVNFFPTLTQTLGYSRTVTLLLCAPPWIFASLVCVLNALHSDFKQERFFHISWNWWAVMIGYVIAMSSQAIGARYVSLFLLANGYSGFALTAVWVSSTIHRPTVKRAAAIGSVNAIGNLGNLVGSYVWNVRWGPTYRNSMAIGIAGISVAMVLGFIIRRDLDRLNRKLDGAEATEPAENAVANAGTQERVETAAKLEGVSVEEAIARKRGFRYVL